MSRDQRPGKIKLVSGKVPMRRRSDRAPAADDAQERQIAQQVAATKAPTADRSKLVMAILFLSGCALGGAGLIALLRTLA